MSKEVTLVDTSSMNEEMSTEFTKWLKEAITNNAEGDAKEKRVAAELRNKADENYGSVWHCVIGKSMAVAIRHQEDRFAHWTYNFDWHVYLWKTL